MNGVKGTSGEMAIEEDLRWPSPIVQVSRGLGRGSD